ncbi:adenylyl-sulfate kinase [Rarobacter incanus]|uniref:adenylyl-sulfate kinase n=1 Tax=Rarobacter incanus TaxID=153494 RepID=UPI001B861EA0|nr:adenylyl-sulfate kinase [Rarobacter incanus]
MSWSEVDLIEAAVLGFVRPQDLRLANAREECLVLCDPENTPFARVALAAGGIRPGSPGYGAVGSVEMIRRPVPAAIGVSAWSPDAGALAAASHRPIVVVDGFPTYRDLAAFQDAAAPPVWVVPVSRDTDNAERGDRLALCLQRAVDDGELVGSVVTVPDFIRARGDLVKVVGADGTAHTIESTLARLLAAPVRAVKGTLGAWTCQQAPGAVVDGWIGSRSRRAARGCVVLFSGLSGSGKSTVAKALASRLEHDGVSSVLIDGDEARQMLTAGLGFDRASRDLNVERLGYVATAVSRVKGVAILAPIAPFAAARAQVRERAERVGSYVLVHVATPLEVCEERDRKGLYARARAGEIADFTGISSPYEVPLDADVVVDTSRMDVETAVDSVMAAVSAKMHVG